MKELWKLFCDTVKELFNDNLRKIKEAAIELYHNVLGLILNFVKVVVNIFGLFIAGVIAAFGKLIDSIIKLLGE